MSYDKPVRRIATSAPASSARAGPPSISRDGVVREAAGRSVEQLAQDENEMQIGLLRLRAEHELRPQHV